MDTSTVDTVIFKNYFLMVTLVLCLLQFMG